jgi:hypothetical protein
MGWFSWGQRSQLNARPLHACEMIFRVTRTLGKKIGIAPSRCLPPDENPFADWSGHVFTAKRVHYVIITNTSSLYSLLMDGRGITDDNQFLRRILSHMSEFMARGGNDFVFRRLIAPETRKVAFSKTSNRRVMGSMNDLILHAKIHLVDGGMSPFDASAKLNEMPMSYLGYGTPNHAFRSLKIEKSGAFGKADIPDSE